MGNSTTRMEEEEDSSSALYTLSTPMPEADANLILKLFPQATLDETLRVPSQKTRVLALLWEGITLFLVPGPRQTLPCFMSSLDQTTNARIHNIPIRKIELTSGSILLLIPPKLIQSSRGRCELAKSLLPAAASRDHQHKDDNSSSQDRKNGNDHDENNFDHNNDNHIDDDDDDDDSTEPTTPAKNSSNKSSKNETKTSDNPSISLPSVKCSLVRPGKDSSPLPLNARKPQPFETDLFQGHYSMILRPDDPPTTDPYWNERLFSQKKRRLVLQLQGKFKREPKGIVYAGGELDQPMKLGLVTKGTAKLLLKLVESYNANVHYSFGGDGQQSHIVMPAFTSFERVVATPPDETPPEFGTSFEESLESRKYRKESRSTGSWNTNDTYSLEFFSMYIDLVHWKLVNLPISGDISLRTFWGESTLRVCLYEMPTDEPKHNDELKQYLFAAEIKYIGDKKPTEEDSDNKDEREGDDDDDSKTNEGGEDDILQWTNSERPRRFKTQESDSSNPIMRSESSFFTTEEGAIDDTTEVYYFDAEEVHIEEADSSIGSADGKLYDGEAEKDLLSQVDYTCPFWLDICNQKGGYSKFYAFNTDDRSLGLWPALACEILVRGNKRIKRAVERNFSPRISPHEWTRRASALAYQDMNSAEIAPGNWESFISHRQTEVEDLFLNKDKPLIAEGTRIYVQSFVARAISDRHWIEEYARLNPSHIEFFHPERRKPHFKLPVTSILRVEPLKQESSPPVTGFHFCSIFTVGRTFYFMFREQNDLRAWIDALSSICASSSDFEAVLDNPAEEFMHKSTMWKCKNRRILNCARFSFYSKPSLYALETVTIALKRAVTLTTEMPDNEKRRLFLETAATLKEVNCSDLIGATAISFFINLYHLMISHAFVVLGPPNWSLKWIQYFNSIAYQVGDDIFSISELEHCIIRNKMSSPTQFLSKFAIPKSNYGRMALGMKDFRINFALNCGSLSNPGWVFCYDNRQLDEQLDKATSLYLRNVTVTKKTNELVIQLPRICGWFRDDFGESEESTVRRLQKYLPDEPARQLMADSDLPVTIRYMQYDFECRQFALAENL